MAIRAGQIMLGTDIGRAGVEQVTITGAISGTAEVVFDPPLDTAPVVACQVVSPRGTAIGSTVLVHTLSEAGFTIRLQLAGVATDTYDVHWIALTL